MLLQVQLLSQSSQLMLLSIAGAIARSQAFFGQGTGAILLDQVGCNGTETRLVDCTSNPLGIHDCSHFEDAGVTCQSTYRSHSYSTRYLLFGDDLVVITD